MSRACVSACASCKAHFNQASEDIRQIVISAEKVENRGARITESSSPRMAGASDVVPLPIARKLEAGE